MKTRIKTGALLIALLVAIVWIDGRWPGPWPDDASWQAWWGDGGRPPVGIAIVLFTLVVVAPLLGAEIARLLGAAFGTTLERMPMAIPLGTSLTALAVLLAGLGPDGAATAVLPIALVVLTAAGSLLGRLRAAAASGDLKTPLLAASGGALAAAYAGGSLGGWLLLRQEHPAWVLGAAVLSVKSCDIGAYFTGMAIGRRKLIPWLSPGKTWEGLFGGVAFSAAVAAGFAAWAQAAGGAAAANLPGPAVAAVVGGLLGLLGQAGDLAESVLKRAAGAKDSGRTLPGLGGVFDVMDSLLPAGLLLPLLLAA